ncbi:MAG: protein translocase subunit SecF [Candidatus Sungbacteria bacterium]|nr:protein translocase subunit SecF [Candidatus Sungbacteria bacterium]
MFLIKHRKLTYIISGTLVLLSILFVSWWGLKLGIDFTGGSFMEVEYQNTRPPMDEVKMNIENAGIPHAAVQPTGERGFFIRTGHLTEDQHQVLLNAMRGDDKNEVLEKRFDAIGPTIGQELKRKSVWAIGLVILLIVLYIAWAFRKVSEPVASWKYGVATIIALVHDVMIPVGIFSILGHFYGVEVDTLFVTALLTILGFSVHDTIVVFDRIRENLKNSRSKSDFEMIVGSSISQTIVRSVNTSFTVLLVMLAIYFFGGSSISIFALTLIIGIFFGTYSSICLASPILVTWQKWSGKRA